jgi:hypothetical protein
MSASRAIAVLGIILGAGFLLLFSLRSSYLSFVGKDTAYYRQFSTACDSLLEQHPVGTNDWIYRKGHRSRENSIEIPATDASVPKIIGILNPERIVIYSNKVFILVGVGRGAFSIIWAQDKGSNGWTLHTYAENLEKLHYETTKLQF